jgi:glycosyltransferase involved in cell wall biosynthesis
MRILFLTQIVPYPPTAGPKIKTWHVLRHLASRGHEIVLASFVRADEEEYVPALKEVCAQVHAVPIRRSRVVDGMCWLRSHLTGRPFLVERDDLPGMRSLVRRLLNEQPFGSIHADQVTMAQFALPYLGTKGPRPLLVFDAHNATWTILERMCQTLPGHLGVFRPLLRLEARRVKDYEGMIVEAFDHTLAVTQIDRRDLIEALKVHRKNSPPGNGRVVPRANPDPHPITVVPIAVDTSKHQPTARQPGSTSILTLGSLNYPPNADGVRWFAQDVFPLVRQKIAQATLTIIGKNPPQDLVELSARMPESMTVTGYVPDLQPYLERAALVVVPVRAGSGMRVRILDMFALAMPVVTTTVGLEGIEAEQGKEVLVADTPDEFATAVIRLIQDEALQARLAAHGRRLAEERYDWRAALHALNDIYKGIL